MWDKRDDMIVRTESPYNAEPPPSVLASAELTPVEAFYARNHGSFPQIATEQWQLTVAGLVDKPVTLTYQDLTTKFPQHTVVATLACAGNRRAEFLRVRPMPGKAPWRTARFRPPSGAVCDCQMSCVRPVFVAVTACMSPSARQMWLRRLDRCSPSAAPSR